MSCRYVFFFIAIGLCIIQSQAVGLKRALKLLDNDKTCYFEHYGKPLSEAEWIEGVDIASDILDIAPAFTKLYTARTRNIRQIRSVAVNGQTVRNYVDIFLIRGEKYNNLDLVMTLGTGFKNYEENETSIVMKINVTFSCENGFKSLEIRQKIIDTNNHDPQFIRRDFKFYTPEYLDTNHVIGRITARDIDLTNRYINFNFRSTGNNTEREYALLGSYQDQNDPKTHHALLVTTRNTSVTYREDIDIYAQDSGKPSRTDNAEIYLIPQRYTTTSSTTTPTTTITPPPASSPEEESPSVPQEESTPSQL